jgi:hypothetical protein
MYRLNNNAFYLIEMYVFSQEYFFPQLLAAGLNATIVILIVIGPICPIIILFSSVHIINQMDLQM